MGKKPKNALQCSSKATTSFHANMRRHTLGVQVLSPAGHDEKEYPTKG